jgi:hypothetical protein
MGAFLDQDVRHPAKKARHFPVGACGPLQGGVTALRVVNFRFRLRRRAKRLSVKASRLNAVLSSWKYPTNTREG